MLKRAQQRKKRERVSGLKHLAILLVKIATTGQYPIPEQSRAWNFVFFLPTELMPGGTWKTSATRHFDHNSGPFISTEK